MIEFKGSPNYNKRNKKVTKIVIHWFGSGTLESANTRFQNPVNKVSAHYGVSKGRIWQWVKEEDVAWHSGNGAVNAESIGIEHDATTKHNLSELDYQTSAKLIAQICARHNIPVDREHIIQHKQVKPTQCPGTIDLDKLIRLARTMVLNVQLVTNQTFPQQLVDMAKARMSYLSEGKIELNFLPIIQTNYTGIPAKIYMQWGEEDCAVDKDWFIDNIWVKNKTADIVVFVGKKGDWQYQHNGITTFGHYYSEADATFPALIQLVTEPNDVSWKWPLNAFVHYLTHEISHPLQQMCGPDRTHEYDYKSLDGLKEVLPKLDFNKINQQLNNKIDYMNTFPYFVKPGDPTIYVNIGGMNLMPVAASWDKFIADYPGGKKKTLSANDFLDFNTGSRTVVKDR